MVRGVGEGERGDRDKVGDGGEGGIIFGTKSDMPHDTDFLYPIWIRAFFKMYLYMGCKFFLYGLEQIMENIFLSYFWMYSERRTVLSSKQHDFFAKF